MAHYAKISNEEFTVSQRARISEIYKEIGIIKYDNRASDGYIAVKSVLDAKTNDTLIQLQSDLNNLYASYEFPDMPPQEEVDALQAAIQTSKDTFRAECNELFEQLEILENEGTEALVAERESLWQEIKNSLCRVTKVLTGADEIEMVKGEDAEIEAQIQALQESIIDLSDVEQVISVSQQIKDLQDSIPDVEKDNTEYWESFYGPSKRTSYNTSGGVHKNGGTPFRKNYAAKGYIYDPVRDAFYPPQPYASWTLNEDTCFWEPPVARPEGAEWYWKEDTTEWVDYVYINETGPAPYDSWIWDTTEGKWKAPVDYPEDGITYVWDEDTLSWDSRQPYPSWVWDERFKYWKAPVNRTEPDTFWNEEKLIWE